MWDGRGEWGGGGGVGGLQWAEEAGWWYMVGSGWWCVGGIGKDRGPSEEGEEEAGWGGATGELRLCEWCGWWWECGWGWGTRGCPVGCPIAPSPLPLVMTCLCWSWGPPDCWAASCSCTNIMWSPTRNARVSGERPDRKSLTCKRKTTVRVTLSHINIKINAVITILIQHEWQKIGNITVKIVFYNVKDVDVDTYLTITCKIQP